MDPGSRHDVRLITRFQQFHHGFESLDADIGIKMAIVFPSQKSESTISTNSHPNLRQLEDFLTHSMGTGFKELKMHYGQGTPGTHMAWMPLIGTGWGLIQPIQPSRLHSCCICGRRTEMSQKHVRRYIHAKSKYTLI